MPKRFEPPDWEGLQRRVIGLGERSHRKNHFAVLQEQLEELELSRGILKSERDLSQLYLDTVPAIVVVLDASGRISMVNPYGSRLLGYSTAELCGRNWFEACVPPGSTRQLAIAHFERMLQGSPADPTYFESELLTRDRRRVLVAWRDAVLRDPLGRITGTLAAGEDITERRAAEHALHELAFFDPLTALPNRRLLIDRLQQCMAAAKRNGSHAALVFVDIDHFKLLNDTRGHGIGDRLLEQAALRLKECVRLCDTVARLGGDEFVVLLQQLHPRLTEAASQVGAVAEKLLRALEQPFTLPGADHQTTASAGVVLFKGTETTVDELLRHADLAMYQAKAAGRNVARFFDPTMQAEVNARATMADDLRAALMRADITLHYQPQVGADGRLVGIEALARWHHPSGRWIPPAEFVSLAEEAGLMAQLGSQILTVACDQLAHWSSIPEFDGRRLSVNVSPVQLRAPDFVAALARQLRDAHVDPTRLKIEITENVLVHNPEDVIVKLNALNAIGVTVALDDFGTGYSSLSYLKRLPIDQIKIDRSFVQDIPGDANSVAICNAILSLGASLGLEVIAEGVELKPQWEHLRTGGCHAAQGYYFCKPLHPDQVPAWLAAKRSGAA